MHSPSSVPALPSGCGSEADPCTGNLHALGIFHGNMVVTMRPFPGHQVAQAAEITARLAALPATRDFWLGGPDTFPLPARCRYPRVHGGPVHVGDPSAIGISDLSRPDYGDAVTVRPGEVPVFWACGVTPQNVLLESK